MQNSWKFYCYILEILALLFLISKSAATTLNAQFRISGTVSSITGWSDNTNPTISGISFVFGSAAGFLVPASDGTFITQTRYEAIINRSFKPI